MSTPIRKRSKWPDDIKWLIESLREGSNTTSELARKLGELDEDAKIPDALRKRVERNLGHLENWGLVGRKSDGRWAWFLNVRKFSNRAEYEVCLNHSRQLIPALEVKANLLSGTKTFPRYGEGLDKMFIDSRMAESVRRHLEEYPVNSQLKRLEKDERKFEGMKSQFEDNVLRSLKKFGELVDRAEGPTKQVYVGDNAHKAILDIVRCRVMGYPPPAWNINSDDKRISLFDLTVGRGEEVFERLKDFIERKSRLKEARDLVEAEGELNSTRLVIANEIRMIILKIENGQPIQGRCDLCPNVQIGETTPPIGELRRDRRDHGSGKRLHGEE